MIQHSVREKQSYCYDVIVNQKMNKYLSNQYTTDCCLIVTPSPQSECQGCLFYTTTRDQNKNVALFCFKRIISKKGKKRKQSLFLACFHFLTTLLKSKLVGDFKTFDLSHKNPSLFSFVYLKTRNSVKSKQKKKRCFWFVLKFSKSKHIRDLKKFDSIR